jgi:hypothetical protein
MERLLKELSENQKTIKRKFVELAENEKTFEESLKKSYAPLIEPLNKLVKSEPNDKILVKEEFPEIKNENKPIKKRKIKKQLDLIEKPETDIESEYESTFETTLRNENDNAFNAERNLATSDDSLEEEEEDEDEMVDDIYNDDGAEKTLLSQYIDNYRLKNKNDFGIYLTPKNVYKIGNLPVTIDDRISIGGKEYKTTQGLLELLFKPLVKKPYTKDDLNNYRQILLDSNAYRENFDPEGKLMVRNSNKYRSIIKNLLLKGGSMVLNNKSERKIIYSNVNQMVERLKKLLMSRNAGNNNLQSEINQIITIMRKNGVIL